MVSHPWVVYSKAPFGNPETVIGYVSRYTHRVAISNTRILSVDNGIIRFSFKNYKNKDNVENASDLWEETELPADEFIRRFLYHVLPSRYHRIRHYGFLSNNQKAIRQQIRESLTVTDSKPSDIQNTDKIIGTICPICKTGVMVTIVVVNGSDMMIKGSYSELNQFIAEPCRATGHPDTS